MPGCIVIQRPSIRERCGLSEIDEPNFSSLRVVMDKQQWTPNDLGNEMFQNMSLKTCAFLGSGIYSITRLRFVIWKEGKKVLYAMSSRHKHKVKE